MYACEKCNVPYVLAGSIRDDGPLPEVIANVYHAQDAMRFHARKATTVIAMATQLHSIAFGNMSFLLREVSQNTQHYLALDTQQQRTIRV